MIRLSDDHREKLRSTRDILITGKEKPNFNAMWWYVDGLIDGSKEIEDVIVLLRWRTKMSHTERRKILEKIDVL